MILCVKNSYQTRTYRWGLHVIRIADYNFFKKDSISDTVLAKCKTANACLLKRIAQKWKRKLTKSSLDNKMKVLAYSLIGENIKTLMVHSKEKIRASQLQVRDAN